MDTLAWLEMGFGWAGGIVALVTLVALTGMGLVLRARREEQVLADEFGQEWQDYCRRVPAFFPRIFRWKNHEDG